MARKSLAEIKGKGFEGKGTSNSLNKIGICQRRNVATLTSKSGGKCQRQGAPH